MTLLLVGVIGAPLLAGVCLIVAARWLPPSVSHWIGLVVLGVAALCALGLIPYAGQDPAIEVTWLPGMGAMTLELGATGLYAAAVTTWAALLTLLGTTSPETRCPPLSAAVVLITLAAATVAFMAGHFLLRYAALEIVALGVAVAPFVELRGGEGARLGRLVYLLLRVGDAGLLAAILILLAGSGTLEIGPALQAGLTLDETGLRWAALGLVLAVWVKVGGWPFSLWLQAGSQLSLRSRTWLYATVMPNLGLYLLYRVTPLLAAAGPVQSAALWIGASSAMLAAFVVLFQPEPRAALPYLWVAQGGLAMLVAASGGKVVVWLALLAVTPLRLLLYGAIDLSERHRARSWMLILGGTALTIWSLLITYWARASGASPDALLVAEVAAALLGVWTARAGWRSFRAAGRISDPAAMRASWTHRAVCGLLAAGVLAAAVVLRPLLQHLANVAHGTVPAHPAALSLARYVATTPATWIVLLLVVVVWRMRWRPQPPVLTSSEQLYDLEEGLARIAQVLRAMIEVGLQEDLIIAIVRAVVGGATWTRRVVEQGALEGSVRHVVRAVVDGGRFTYRVIEQEGLEGLLRYVVAATFKLAHVVRGWHTGKLRRNLMWVGVSLALAMLFMLAAW